MDYRGWWGWLGVNNVIEERRLGSHLGTPSASQGFWLLRMGVSADCRGRSREAQAQGMLPGGQKISWKVCYSGCILIYLFISCWFVIVRVLLICDGCFLEMPTIKYYHFKRMVFESYNSKKYNINMIFMAQKKRAGACIHFVTVFICTKDKFCTERPCLPGLEKLREMDSGSFSMNSTQSHVYSFLLKEEGFGGLVL